MILRHARTFALVVLVTLAGPVAEAAAQDLHPSRRPSPVGIAKTFVGDTYVKITYGRPYARGRAIFGDPADGNTYLVPFGQTWRTGANEATEITVTGPVHIGGERLEAGTYALFTVPGASTWEIRLNPELGMDGTGRLGPDGSFTNAYDPAADLLVIEAQPGTLAQAVDQFTIVFEPVGNGVHMVLSWENTEVRVPIEAAER
jgi:hypothetical protein